MNHLANKWLTTLLNYGLLFTLFIACSPAKQISAPATQEEITQAINNDHWNFTADYAMPSYGRSRSLTSGYTVTCRKDSLNVALPYFGRLNSPAGALNGNPLEFQSTDFKLTKENKKGGGWIVTIKSANPEVQSMVFTFLIMVQRN